MNDISRLSIPVRGDGRTIDEADLRRSSFDLWFFPRTYLARKVPLRVRVEVSNDSTDASDVGGWFEDTEGQHICKYVALVSDNAGCPTDSDDLYRAIHAAFIANADGLRYIGFFRCGRPPYAPLFALGMLYTKYGRGLYRDGEYLPIPWPALTTRSSFVRR
ncbi:hypothetical protein QFZ94_003830 [Paraburkholderia sp. JPY465]|uniref:hypothetical protein n=1 Tax=Paraburkholderia sp. JPY465 TaxID=3042285 RepID=UPI003D1E963B